MNQRELDLVQIAFEEKYSKRSKFKILKEYFFDVLINPFLYQPNSEELINSIKIEVDKPEVNVFNLSLEIMGILADKSSLSITAILEMIPSIQTMEPSKVLELLVTAHNIGYFTVISNERGDNIKLYRKFELDAERKAKLAQFKYLNPMLVRPLFVNGKLNNRGSGYLTIGSDSLILGDKFNHHKNDINAEFLDVINSVQFELNTTVIKNYKNSWDNLDKPKEGETSEEFEKRKLAFENFEETCYQTFKEMLAYGNSFYLTHKYDKRGRIYSCGYAINYQGNHYSKAILELKNKELVSDEINFF